MTPGDVVVPEVLPSSVDEWAGRIQGHMADAVGSVIAVGQDFVSAKAALGHGEMATLAARVGLSTRSIERYVSIASLANATRVSHLPASVGALYELSRLDRAELEHAIEEGAVSPDMERKDAAALVKRVRAVEAKQPDPEPPPGATDAEARDALYNLQHKLAGYQALKKRAGKLLADQDWDGCHKLATLALYLNVNKRFDYLQALDSGSSYDSVRADVDAWRAGTDLAGPAGGVPATAAGSATDLETTDVTDPGDDLDAEVPPVSDGATTDALSTGDVMDATSASPVEMSGPPDSAPTEGSADASEGAAVNTNHGPAAPDEVDDSDIEEGSEFDGPTPVHDRPRHSMGTSTLADLARRPSSGSGRKVSREILMSTRSAVADVIATVEQIDPWSVEGVQVFGDEADELHTWALQLSRWASALEAATRPAEGGRS